MPFEDAEVPVIGIGDLIEMKARTGRPQGEADVYYLRRIAEQWKDE